LECQARTNLEAVLTPAQMDRYRVTRVLRNGAAAQEILRYLQEHGDIGLVIMATHGRGGVARLLMGSVADKVVRMARCPVVTMRVPNGEAPDVQQAA
jgi:nucleotide-binding universal stress UspA family protein